MVMQEASTSETTEGSPPAHRRWVEAVLPSKLRNQAERRNYWVEVALPRGSSSEAERPWRAASLTLAGAITILFFAYPRKLSLTTVQWLGLWGQLVSMVAIVLAIFMLVYPRSANVTGPFAIIAGILSFPIILGGLLVGSICLVLGGALAFAWMPAPPEARAYASRSPHSYLLLPYRVLSDLIDGVIFLIAVLIPGYTFLHGPMKDSPPLVFLIELLLWGVIFIPGTARGVTPGKLLLRLRIWDVDTTKPPGMQRAVIREGVRGAEMVGLIVMLPLLFDVPQIIAFAMIAAVTIAGVTSAHFGVMPHDLLAGTGVSLLHVVLPEDDELTEASLTEDSAMVLPEAEHIVIPEPARPSVISHAKAAHNGTVRVTDERESGHAADDDHDPEIDSLVESLDAVLAAATRDPSGRPARDKLSRDKKDSAGVSRASPTGKERVRKTAPK